MSKKKPSNPTSIKIYHQNFPRPELVGQVYGSFTIIEDLGIEVKHGSRMVKARCKCGDESTQYLTNMRRRFKPGCDRRCKKCALKDAHKAFMELSYKTIDRNLYQVFGDWMIINRVHLASRNNMMYYVVRCSKGEHYCLKSIKHLRKGYGLTCLECLKDNK